METTKQSKCPKCGADMDNIDWGGVYVDGATAWQEATCNECNCTFSEQYEYKRSITE